MSNSEPNGYSEKRKEIEPLLTEAVRLEDRGDIEGAIRWYRQALEQLPAKDPMRERLQSTVDFLEQSPATEQAPRARPKQLEPVRAPGIPSWLLGVGIVAATIAVSLCILSVYLIQNFNKQPIPRLGSLAPTPLFPALAPTFPVSPTAIPTLAVPGAPTGIAHPTPSILPTAVPLASPTPFGPAQPPRVLFEDDFKQGKLDTSKWTYDNQKNTLLEWSHGDVRVYSGAPHSAYVHTNANPFPQSGDFQVDIRFRYFRLGMCGVPVAMASFFMPPGISQDQANAQSAAAEASGGVSIWFWHDKIFYRSGAVREDIAMTNAGTDWHQVTVKYVGNQYQIIVDSNALYTSQPTSARPQVLWFGNPFNLPNRCEWDTLEIPHIAVGALP